MILHSGQRPKREHKLLNLFEMLSPSQQGQLIQHVRLGKGEFEKEIGRMSNAFAEWRYVYEYPELQISLGFLDRLARAAQEVCTNVIGP